MTPRSSAIRRCRSVVLWLLLAALGHGEPGCLSAAEGTAPPKWPDDFGKQELINTYFVLLNPAVAAELKLTEAQIQSLKQQQTGPGGAERISDEELEKILPAEQLRRFRQIQLQRAAVLLGPAYLFRHREVVERLELTEDQVPRLQAAYRAVQESFTARIRRPMTPDERKAQQTQIDLLLTIAQRERWTEMLGEPVSAEALQTTPLVRASQVQLRSPSPASAGPPAAVVYRRQEGGPLSMLAAVLQPAPIAGLRSWTIETRGHRGPLHAVAYSPDGRWIATGGNDGSIRVWDVPYQHLQQAFLGHHDRITSLAFSPDGKYLASSSLDGAVGLWELASGRLVRMLLGHSAAVNDVNWAPDSLRLVSAGADGTLRIWQTDSETAVQTLSGHAGWVHGVCWSPDGQTIASASTDRKLRLWDATTGSVRKTMPASSGSSFRCVAFSADGTRLATAGGRTVQVWDLSQDAPVRTLTGHTGTIERVAWSPSGNRLASAAMDRTVRLWDLDGDQPPRVLGGPGDYYVYAVAWSPDGQTLASVDSQGLMCIVDASSGRRERFRPGHPFWGPRCVWSPAGDALASVAADKDVRIWRPGAGGLIQVLKGHTEWVFDVAWSPDGRHLASGGPDQTVQVWELPAGRLVHALKGHTGSILRIAWSPDSRYIATSSEDSSVRIWDNSDGSLWKTLQGHRGYSRPLDWSSDGKRLASGGHDGAVLVWDVEAGEIRHRLSAPAQVWGLALSPDGQFLAACGIGALARIWNTETMELARTINAGAVSANALAWSKDGKTLAIGGSSKTTVGVYDVNTGERLRELAGHPGGVLQSISYSPDGRNLFAGAWCGMGRVWDAESGRPNGCLLQLGAGQGLAVSADGHYDGTEGVQDGIVFVAEQPDGVQRTLAPHEFAGQYGWKNDPARAKAVFGQHVADRDEAGPAVANDATDRP